MTGSVRDEVSMHALELLHVLHVHKQTRPLLGSPRAPAALAPSYFPAPPGC